MKNDFPRHRCTIISSTPLTFWKDQLYLLPPHVRLAHHPSPTYPTPFLPKSREQDVAEKHASLALFKTPCHFYPMSIKLCLLHSKAVLYQCIQILLAYYFVLLLTITCYLWKIFDTGLSCSMGHLDWYGRRPDNIEGRCALTILPLFDLSWICVIHYLYNIMNLCPRGNLETLFSTDVMGFSEINHR